MQQSTFLQQQVDDPNTNTETKIEFKRQIEELKQQRQNNQLLYENNQKWAKLVFNTAKEFKICMYQNQT
jgi:cell shape-determining protein MreC